MFHSVFDCNYRFPVTGGWERDGTVAESQYLDNQKTLFFSIFRQIFGVKYINDRSPKRQVVKTNDQLKSVNSNFALAVHSPKSGQAKTHFLSHFRGKKEKKYGYLGQNLNPRSVDQKWTLLTISPLVPCQKISKSIFVTCIVLRQKVSLGLSKFW